MEVNSVEIRTSASKREEDLEAYEAAKSVLMHKGINDRKQGGKSRLTFFGYNDDGVAIFAVLPEDLPRCSNGILF